MRVLVVEGGDGCGKTTLSTQLAKDLGYALVHMSVPEPIDKPFQYWMGRIQPLLVTQPKGIVIDRLHWSEDVYGGELRGGSKLTLHERWLLEGWLMAHDVWVIRCRVSRDRAWNNVSQNPTAKHHDPETFLKVYNGYERPWDTQLFTVTYDYTLGDYKWLLGLEEHRGALHAQWQGIGWQEPSVMLVGERHNECKDTLCDRPYVFSGQSGNYLRQAMAVANLPLKSTHITNAFHGVVPLSFGTMPYNGAKVVALGKVADKELNRRGIAHTTVPHPGYWKRFCYSQLDEYAAMLKEAAQ